jgi:hypothetical protein
VASCGIASVWRRKFTPSGRHRVARHGLKNPTPRCCNGECVLIYPVTRTRTRMRHGEVMSRLNRFEAVLKRFNYPTARGCFFTRIHEAVALLIVLNHGLNSDVTSPANFLA